MEQRPDPVTETSPPAPTRRAVLGAALTGASALAVASCSTPSGQPQASPTSPARPASAGSPTSSTSAPTTTAAHVAGPGSGPPAIALTAGDDITHGPSSTHQVALTFHGQGPADLAHEILRACADAEAGITVFAVGTWLRQNPHLGRQVVAAGHELGNHTWSHQQMKQLSAAQAVDEAVRGAHALEAAIGTPGWWFRPSGTQRSTPTIRAAAAAAGYHRCVSYDVDPEDFRDPGGAAVRDRTLGAVKAGSIVSLHFGHRGTVDALPAILAGLQRKGLRAVTLSTMLRDA
ncbi:polysaccharide deacetylase family protein [Phycicoccus sp. Root563]|uniref:polysaccharide deacetylase family protein n=1 Tax=Phycicoccus sp. Root563 TaxID=1736562 RepID=UPI000B2EAC59|nr:polysaccharide deacetylase family protein [Phycicoccus sp. Root563]